MKTTLIACLLSLVVLQQSCVSQENSSYKPTPESELKGLSTAYFASGCFWCVEAVFESVKGVKEAVSGYAGGNTDDPTYQKIGTGTTGHAEAVKVYYDPKIVSFETLVKVFYGSHDPTTVNGQSPDFGSQYRSIIFYTTDSEKMMAQKFKNNLDNSGTYKEPIATEIVQLKKFYNAEEYHQDYERRNPNNPYVRNVSVPRLKKFQKAYPELLKENVH